MRRVQRRRAAASAYSPGHDAGPNGATAWASLPVIASRVVAGREGMPWTVRELDTRDMHRAQAATCLVFENHAVVRRCWHYPADWETLDDAALIQIVEAPL